MEPKGSLLNLQVPTTCPYPEPDQSSPCPYHSTSWRSILILFSHLCLGLPSGLFPFQNHVCTSPLPIMCYMPNPPHLDLITQIILGEEYRSLNSSLFLHSAVTLSLLDPNILLSTMFSNTLSLRSSLNVSNHVLHPHKTTGKTMVLYIFIFIFLGSKLEVKIFCIEW